MKTPTENHKIWRKNRKYWKPGFKNEGVSGVM